MFQSLVFDYCLFLPCYIAAFFSLALIERAQAVNSVKMFFEITLALGLVVAAFDRTVVPTNVMYVGPMLLKIRSSYKLLIAAYK